jgi:hypothetical protein
MLMEAQGAEEKDKWRFSVYDFINEAQGAEEKDKWRFSVYDFINEAQGAGEKDKWRFSVYDFINEARGAEEKDKWRFSVYDFINRVAEQELLSCLRQNTSLQPRQPCHQHLASSFHSPPQKFPPGFSRRSLHVGQIET